MSVAAGLPGIELNWGLCIVWTDHGGWFGIVNLNRTRDGWISNPDNDDYFTDHLFPLLLHFYLLLVGEIQFNSLRILTLSSIAAAPSEIVDSRIGIHEILSNDFN